MKNKSAFLFLVGSVIIVPQVVPLFISVKLFQAMGASETVAKIFYLSLSFFMIAVMIFLLFVLGAKISKGLNTRKAAASRLDRVEPQLAVTGKQIKLSKKDDAPINLSKRGEPLTSVTSDSSNDSILPVTSYALFSSSNSSGSSGYGDSGSSSGCDSGSSSGGGDCGGGGGGGD